MEGLLNSIGGNKYMINISNLSSEDKVKNILLEFTKILKYNTNKEDISFLLNKAQNIANNCFLNFYKSLTNNEHI